MIDTHSYGPNAVGTTINENKSICDYISSAIGGSEKTNKQSL